MTETAVEAPASATIVLLSQPGCYRCGFVERYLNDQGIDFEKVDVSEPGPYRDAMDKAHRMQLPQTLRACDINVPTEWVEGVDLGAIEKLW